MKRNSLLESIPKKIFDQDAVTIEEIMADRCLSRHPATELRNLNLQSGAWEEVWKRVHGRAVRAYRLAKKK